MRMSWLKLLFIWQACRPGAVTPCSQLLCFTSAAATKSPTRFACFAATSTRAPQYIKTRSKRSRSFVSTHRLLTTRESRSTWLVVATMTALAAPKTTPRRSRCSLPLPSSAPVTMYWIALTLRALELPQLERLWLCRAVDFNRHPAAAFELGVRFGEKVFLWCAREWGHEQAQKYPQGHMGLFMSDGEAAWQVLYAEAL
jgi:hypothetical protein